MSLVFEDKQKRDLNRIPVVSPLASVNQMRQSVKFDIVKSVLSGHLWGMA